MCMLMQAQGINDKWELYKFIGSKFQNLSQEHGRKYLSMPTESY